MTSLAEKILRESIDVKLKLLEKADLIDLIARKIAERIKNGGKVILFGNGGSAADAQHIACELIGKFRYERPPYPAIAITTNTSALTAIANDLGFEDVFARQIEGLVSEKDVVIGITTSGRSSNVIKGLRTAKKKGAMTVALTGEGGKELEKIVDYAIVVSSSDTPRIQEAHITIGHIICEIVERTLTTG